jgi:hypothetical protein
MVETLIVRLVRACCRYPSLTVIVASLITLGAGIYSYENFAIHTDTSQLISSRLPWRQRELQLDAAFPQFVDTILVVLDGATPELARDGSSRLAAALAEDRANFQAVQEEVVAHSSEEWAPVFAARRSAAYDRATHPPSPSGTLARSELARTRKPRFHP